MQCHLSVLFLLGVLAGGVQACGPCTCSVGGSGVWLDLAGPLIANCSDMNNLTSVPSTLPQEIQVLHIEKRHGITTLKQNEFTSLPNLEVIYITDGELHTTESHAFSGLTNAKKIFLDNNKLSELPDDIFSDTPNLISVNLQNNQLQRLRRNLFANLKHLKTVNLNRNKIKLVEPHTFINVPALEKLYLEENQLTTLSLDFIDSTCSLKHVYLGMNPWQCEEHVCGVMDVVIKRKMLNVWYRARCSAPSSLEGKQWAELEDHPLVTMCSAKEQCNDRTTKTAAGESGYRRRRAHGWAPHQTVEEDNVSER